MGIMRSRSELEEQYSNTPVRLPKKNTGHGVISLRGRDTSLRMTTSENLDENEPDTGWYDLLIKENNGQKILLLNALTTSSRALIEKRDEWQFDIFPNIVVLNAELLSSGGMVREITLQIDDLNDIFYYNKAEWHSLRSVSPETINSLREIRKIKRPYSRRYDYFYPTDVYLIHRLPRVLRERVGDKVYEVFVGSTEQHSPHKLNIQSTVLASIRFDQPVAIPDAIDAAWAWRRFFHQLAMHPMPIKAISCRSKKSARTPSSDIYLPNIDEEKSPDSSDIFRLRPFHIPYGAWKDRKKFAGAMRKWLELDEKRSSFRVKLDHVMDEMREISSPSLIADLCSAIESLEELRSPSALKDTDLEKMVAAAATVGEKITPPVLPDRIRGLLTLLQHQSLPQRLKVLATAVEAQIPREVSRRVIKHARDFRTREAHGGGWDEMTRPFVTPTLHVLASMCVLWDLTTSGLPASDGNRRLNAITRANLNSAELMARDNRVDQPDT